VVSLSGAAEIHIEEQVNAFLLNGKEWEFLSEIRVDENAQTLDHRSVSFHKLVYVRDKYLFWYSWLCLVVVVAAAAAAAASAVK